MMSSYARRLAFPAFAAIAVCLTTGIGSADIIPAGSDLLHKVEGGADTIIERVSDIELPDTIGVTATLQVQFTLLSLMSAAPVNIGGSFFDVFVHLTPNTTSGGSITLTQTALEGSGITPEGTFTSNLTVFFTADFVQAGVVQPCPISTCLFPAVNLHTNPDQPGMWRDPDDGGTFVFRIVDEFEGELGASLHRATQIPEPFSYFTVGLEFQRSLS